MKNNKINSTTIIGIRKNNQVVIAGDGQASLGNTIMKAGVKKVRRLVSNNSVIAGFAGSTADAFALFERLETKLEKFSSCFWPSFDSESLNSKKKTSNLEEGLAL